MGAPTYKRAWAVSAEVAPSGAWCGSVKGVRGVIFLDPYGMEVEWATVEAIADTQALDLWYFFPLMGLYRQAANDAVAIGANKRARLKRVLGTDDWSARGMVRRMAQQTCSTIRKPPSVRPISMRSNDTSRAASHRSLRVQC
jgi:three-Cys-motif partner protein